MTSSSPGLFGIQNSNRDFSQLAEYVARCLIQYVQEQESKDSVSDEKVTREYLMI